MAETPHDTHNRLGRDFVMQAGREATTYSELLVVIESTMLATLMLLVRQHGIKPDHASIYLETALHAATERFAAEKR